jgi:hypothetical protein
MYREGLLQGAKLHWTGCIAENSKSIVILHPILARADAVEEYPGINARRYDTSKNDTYVLSPFLSFTSTHKAWLCLPREIPMHVETSTKIPRTANHFSPLVHTRQCSFRHASNPGAPALTARPADLDISPAMGDRTTRSSAARGCGI